MPKKDKNEFSVNYVKSNNVQFQSNKETFLANFELVKNAECILDVGCGGGTTTEFMSSTFPDDKAPKITGIDISTHLIERAKNTYGHKKNIHFELQNATTIDKKDTYDLITCFYAAHWFPKDTLSITFKKMFQALTDNGHLLMIIPLYDMPEERKKVITSKKWHDKFIDFKLDEQKLENDPNQYIKAFTSNEKNTMFPHKIKSTPLTLTREDFGKFFGGWSPEVRFLTNNSKTSLSEEYIDDVFEAMKKDSSDKTIDFPETDLVISVDQPTLEKYYSLSSKITLGLNNSNDPQDSNNTPSFINKNMLSQ